MFKSRTCLQSVIIRTQYLLSYSTRANLLFTAEHCSVKCTRTFHAPNTMRFEMKNDTGAVCVP